MPNSAARFIPFNDKNMGYENREYFRDGSYSGGAGIFADAPMCKKIIIATAIVFLIQIFFTRPPNAADFQKLQDVTADIDAADSIEAAEFLNEGLMSLPRVSVAEQWLALDTDKVINQGQVWRLFTCALLHNRFGLWHILVNMFLLYYFGRGVESTYGSREFLMIYVAAALCSSLGFIGIDWLTSPGAYGRAIGASGAVMAILCLFVMWNPRYEIHIWFLFPIQARFLLALYVIYDLHPLLLQLAGTPINTGVAHAGHLGGLLFGFLYFRSNWKLDLYWSRITGLFSSRTGPRKNIRIHRPAPSEVSRSQPGPSPPAVEPEPKVKTPADERFDMKVDAILDKIAKQGEASLTDKERKTLIQGSQRYKNRQ